MKVDDAWVRVWLGVVHLAPAARGCQCPGPRTPYTGRMRWFMSWLKRKPAPPVSDRQRALDLVAAVDAGGLPLNPMRVNAIARSLGLEVSSRAPVEETIERIRRALERDSAAP